MCTARRCEGPMGAGGRTRHALLEQEEDVPDIDGGCLPGGSGVLDAEDRDKRLQR